MLAALVILPRLKFSPYSPRRAAKKCGRLPGIWSSCLRPDVEALLSCSFPISICLHLNPMLCSHALLQMSMTSRQRREVRSAVQTGARLSLKACQSVASMLHCTSWTCYGMTMAHTKRLGNKTIMCRPSCKCILKQASQQAVICEAAVSRTRLRPGELCWG